MCTTSRLKRRPGSCCASMTRDLWAEPRAAFAFELVQKAGSFLSEFTTIEINKPLQRRFLSSPMVVLLNIGVKCSHFRAKAAHFSGHLPLPQHCCRYLQRSVDAEFASSTGQWRDKDKQAHLASSFVAIIVSSCLRSFLGEVHRSVLNGPQRVQRRLLCLGHSLDPRDIEPLVGPVAS